MSNPLRFRPAPLPEGDPDPDSPVQWADNWLSNLLAWASTTFVPAWCQTPDHWTSKVTAYTFSDCPCCLLFRGIMLGLMIELPFLLTLALWR
jgi:hypothetical protein